MSVITASRSSECVNCEEGIRAGQRIAPVGEGKWAHVACPMPRPICESCWTQKSVTGACLCEGVAA